MEIFTDKVIPVTMKTWTIDLSDTEKFTKNPESQDEWVERITQDGYGTPNANNHQPYFCTDEFAKSFKKATNYYIEVYWREGKPILHIAEFGTGNGYAIREGDTIFFNSNPQKIDVLRN